MTLVFIKNAAEKTDTWGPVEQDLLWIFLKSVYVEVNGILL